MRIGINVPNELIKQVKELDPGVNISRVCRETLKSYCLALERINNWIDDYDYEEDEQMMRLSQEPPIEPDWVGYGLEDAREWVRDVEPQVWQWFWHSYDTSKDEAKESRWPSDFHWPLGADRFHVRYMENYSWFMSLLAGPTQGDRRDAYDKARQDYYLAWFGYVREVRRRQLQYFEDERRRVMAEREQAWQAFCEPELPPQLRV